MGSWSCVPRATQKVAILILLDFVVQFYYHISKEQGGWGRNPYFTRFCCAMKIKNTEPLRFNQSQSLFY